MSDKATDAVAAAQTTAETVGHSIDHLVDKASAGLDQVTHMLAQHAPQAWELAAKGVYARGASTLVVGSIGFVVFLILAACSVGFGLTAARCFKSNGESSEVAGLYCGMSFVAGALAVVFCIISSLNIMDSDSWARVISPQGYLVQEIVSKALGSGS